MLGAARGDSIEISASGDGADEAEPIAFHRIASLRLADPLIVAKSVVRAADVARWTGARERTVKNWFAGSCAPKGDHFRDLVRHCPEMLDAFLVSVDRQDHLALAKVVQVEAALLDALAAIARLKR